MSKITIDVLNCNAAPISQHNTTSRNVLDEFMRHRHIKASYESVDDISEAVMAYPEVNWRYYVGARNLAATTSNISHMNFSPKNTWPYQESGRLDA